MKEFNIDIRKCEIKDVDLIYSWINDPLVRSKSFTSEEIPYVDHCNWFNKMINDDKAFFMIGLIEFEPACFVRFYKEKEASKISILISKKYRGQGLAKTFIRRATREYHFTHEENIIAYIKKDNTASINSFEKAGFTFLKESNIQNSEAYVYQFKKHKNETNH